MLTNPPQTRERNAPGYTLASLISRTAALSTMFRTVNRLIALSLATHREQLEHRTNPTCPRPFLLRPPFLLFLVCRDGQRSKWGTRQPVVIVRGPHPSSLPPHPSRPILPFLVLDQSPARKRSLVHVSEIGLTMLQCLEVTLLNLPKLFTLSASSRHIPTPKV